MKLRQVIWLLPAVAVVALLVGTYLSALPNALRHSRRSPCGGLKIEAVKKPVSLRGVTLPDLEGKPHRLSDLRGRTILLNYWLTTCKPCLEEIPSLLDLASRYRHQGLVMLLVATDKKVADVKASTGKFPRLAHLPPNAIVLSDPGGVLAKRMGTEKYPETYLISPAFRVTGRIVGARDWTRKQSAACIYTKLP